MTKARSLAAKLAGTHALVAMLGCLLSGLLLAILLPEFYLRQREAAIFNQSRALAKEIAPWLADARLESYLTIAGLEGTGLRVLDTKMQVVARCSEGRMGWGGGAGGPGQGRMARQGVDKIWQEHWDKILAGEVLHQHVKTTAGEQLLVIALPVSYEGRVVGAIVLHARMAELRDSTHMILPVIAVVSLLAGIVAALAGRLLSIKLARPLQRMTRAAEQAARGDLKAKVEPPDWREAQSLALAFNHMLKNLSAQEEAQRRFVADASHQLRAPLTTLQMQAEALLDNMVKGEAEQKKYISHMAQETKILAALAQNLLDLERLEAGNTLPALQTLELGRLLQDIGETFKEDNKPEITVEIATDLPAVLADPEELRQALVNLLDNAIKHTDVKGQIRLWALPEKGQVRIGVSDTGCGIAPDFLPRIFDRFFSIPGDATKGSGLGLAITKRLVARQGGELSVESQPGKGTTFSFLLPSAES